MSTYNVHEAKPQLSKLLDAALRGETVTIANAGKPVASLGPLKPTSAPRVRGVLKGQIGLGPEFDEPLPADVLEQFEAPERTSYSIRTFFCGAWTMIQSSRAPPGCR
jgi:prevent-host-death family protein